MRGFARAVMWCFLGAGLLAPFLANDVPLVASVGGELRFPAAVTWIGGRPAPPGDAATWKKWWVALPDDGPDWAVMPLVPYGPHEPVRDRVRGAPDAFHFLGNDRAGRDVLARLLHGASTALWIALGTVLMAAALGVPLGLTAGYRGGVVDLLVTALVQVFLCFPPVFFVLAVMAFVGNSLAAVIVVLGSLYWVSFARIVRGEVLGLREREFVRCARGLGVSPGRVLCRHVLPQVRGPILVNAAFVAASAIVVEASLSFLGIGPGLSVVSWGGLLMQGKESAQLGAWHLWLFPSLVLIAVVVGLHTLADGAGGAAGAESA